jgi:Predicted dehydrogenases and related proteins
MENFKWGIIGPGQIARDFAEDIRYAQHKKHIVQSVLSHTLDKAKEFAEEERAPRYFDDIDRFLQQSDIDAVYIATPHTLHHEQTVQCLQHKVPVLCEKPLAINSGQVQEMIDAAKTHQTFLMEGMWIRFLPSIQKVLSIIDEGTIGRVVCVKADMSYLAPKEPGSRFYEPEKGGGSLLDLGIYPVYLALLLLGRPTTIQAWARLTEKKIDEGCAAIFHYHNGAYAIIESSLVIQQEWQAFIYGEKGKIRIRRPWNEKPEGIEVDIYNRDITIHRVEWKGRGLQYEVDEVVECIRRGKLESRLFDHASSMLLMETMDAIRKLTGIRYPEDSE